MVTSHRELKEEPGDSFVWSLRKAHLWRGAAVDQFERDFATFSDTRHCVGVASGTNVLRFSLIAAGIGKDSLVITVPNTSLRLAELRALPIGCTFRSILEGLATAQWIRPESLVLLATHKRVRHKRDHNHTDHMDLSEAAK